MGKYSTIHKGKVLPWNFKKTSVLDPDKKHTHDYKAMLGDNIHVGFIYEKKRNNWTVYGSPFPKHSVGVVSGFNTRWDAMEYLVSIFHSYHADAELLIGENKELLRRINTVLGATAFSVVKPPNIDPKLFGSLSQELTKLLNKD